jgi:hypothetical protein
MSGIAAKVRNATYLVSEMQARNTGIFGPDIIMGDSINFYAMHLSHNIRAIEYIAYINSTVVRVTFNCIHHTGGSFHCQGKGALTLTLHPRVEAFTVRGLSRDREQSNAVSPTSHTSLIYS